MSDEKTCNCPPKLDENMFELSEDDLRHVSGGGGDIDDYGYCRDCQEIVLIKWVSSKPKCSKCSGGNVEIEACG